MKNTLTDKQRQEIETLAAMSDEDIDYSDIPPIREISADAVIGKFYWPNQEVVTISLDTDNLAWLEGTGEDSRLTSAPVRLIL